MGLMSFLRRRLGHYRGMAPNREFPDDPSAPPEEARVPLGPPRGPRPTLSAELPLPDEPTPPTDARSREPER